MMINNNKKIDVFLQKYVNLLDYCMYDFLGGPKVVQIRLIVNFFKALTLPYIFCLMKLFNNYSLGAYLYLTFHGSYGIIWLFKDLIFPDINFQKYTTIPSTIGGSIILIVYWIIPFIQISGYGVNHPQKLQICIYFFIYVFGLLTMIASDCQKYFTLLYKKGLITEGMFKYNRNPNYTGEILIYLSFALLTNNFVSYLIVFGSWILMFLPFMIRKEISLSQKPGWQTYTQQSYLCFWKISNNFGVNAIIYGCLLTFLVLLAMNINF